MASVPQNVLDFLRGLAENNDREWYQAHKDDYQAAKSAFQGWLQGLMLRVTEAGLAPLHGLVPSEAMYRIFRDVRFHKDKPPYNPWFSATLGPKGRKTEGAAFYIRIQAGKSYAGAGFTSYWSADKMAALRQEIDYEPERLVAWLESSTFGDYFQTLKGESLKRPPKGYDTTHPYIALLKRKEFWVDHPLPDHRVLNDSLYDYLMEVYCAAQPLVEYLNRVYGEE